MKNLIQAVEDALAKHYLEHHPELAETVRQLIEAGQTVKQVHNRAIKVAGGERLTTDGVRALANYFNRIKSNR